MRQVENADELMALEEQVGKTGDEIAKLYVAYEKIRRGGNFNMLTDAKVIWEFMGITRKEYMDIINHYKEYEEIYNDMVEQGLIEEALNEV